MIATNLSPPSIRLFVAVYPVRRLLNELQQMQCALQAMDLEEDVLWSRPSQLHLTLTFLGNMKTEHVEPIENAIRMVAVQTSPIRLRVAKLGCFPGFSRPAVVWAGIQGDVEGLLSLKQRLDEALRFTGFHEEKRSFRPHITLGRLRSRRGQNLKEIGRKIQSLAEREFGAWTANHIRLVRSRLSSSGARYDSLARFSLFRSSVS